MNRAFLAFALIALPSLAAEAPAPTCKPSLQVRSAEESSVIATWYGKAANGRLTAWHFHGRPGTRFDAAGLTAAHRDLPFGSRLRVSRGGLSVLVTVTDRGPLPGTGSDLDLSEEAARRLGMLRAGRAPVTVEVLP